MNKLIAPLMAVALTVFCLQTAIADLRFDPEDIPKQNTKKAKTDNSAPLVIKVNKRAKETRLIIPRSMLPVEDAKVSAVETRGPGLRTVIAGLALSGALISLCFVRRSKVARATAATALILTVALFAFSSAQADIRVPDNFPQRPVPKDIKAQPAVTVEIVEKGDKIILETPNLAPFIKR